MNIETSYNTHFAIIRLMESLLVVAVCFILLIEKHYRIYPHHGFSLPQLLPDPFYLLTYLTPYFLFLLRKRNRQKLKQTKIV